MITLRFDNSLEQLTEFMKACGHSVWLCRILPTGKLNWAFRVQSYYWLHTAFMADL